MELHSYEMMGLPEETREFYKRALTLLDQARVPYLVGGAYAFGCYTGIVRHTKDLDLFTTPADAERALWVLAEGGYRTEKTAPTWIFKAHAGDDFVDIIFRSGNMLSEVDASWFAEPPAAKILDHPIRLVTPEDIIHMKAFIMERERFDGADVAHLLLCAYDRIDWDRLVRRFGENGRVLLAHLLLFGFVYPDYANRIPQSVLQELWSVLPEGRNEIPDLCRGPLLSRAAYLIDTESWGLTDARFTDKTKLGPHDREQWRRMIRDERERDLAYSAISLDDSRRRAPFTPARQSDVALP